MVVAVRHGQTDYNNKKGRDAELFRGNLDIPLNHEGQREARAAAAKIRMAVKLVVSDRMPRDFQTGAIIALEKNAAQIIDDRLAPIDIGVLSGKSVKELAPIVDWFFQHPDTAFPDGDTVGGWYARQKSAIFDYIAEDAGDPDAAIVLIVQGSTFRALPAMMQGDDWSLMEPTTERIRTGNMQWLS